MAVHSKLVTVWSAPSENRNLTDALAMVEVRRRIGAQALLLPRFNLFPCGSHDHNVEIITRSANVETWYCRSTALSLALAVATPAFAQGRGALHASGGR